VKRRKSKYEKEKEEEKQDEDSHKDKKTVLSQGNRAMPQLFFSV